MNIFHHVIILFISLFLLTSCAKTKYDNGYIASKLDTSFIRKNLTTKKQVFSNLGAPSINYNISENNNETQIYLSQEISNFLFFKPKITRRDILIITYNNDIVSNIESFNLNDANKISILDSNRGNNYSIKNKSLLNEIIGNIGKISPN